jgi:excisionase family DNA binding protein
LAETEKLLSVPEAAYRLGISPHTVNSWVSQRRIAFIKVGRRTMFDPEDLSALIQTNKIQPRFKDKPHLN